MTEKNGLDTHFVGEVVIDDDYGIGTIMAILPPDPDLPPELIKTLDASGFNAAMLEIRFNDEKIRVVPSDCVEHLAPQFHET